jgi:hypothetical protein
VGLSAGASSQVSYAGTPCLPPSAFMVARFAGVALATGIIDRVDCPSVGHANVRIGMHEPTGRNSGGNLPSS